MCFHWFTHWFAPFCSQLRDAGCIPTPSRQVPSSVFPRFLDSPVQMPNSCRAVQSRTIGQRHGGRRQMTKATRGVTPWRVSRRKFLASGIAAATIIGVHSRRGSAQDIKTIEAGKLTIGMNGDMPMTQVKDGKLSGTDGELMIFVAEKLGL